jgi:hypothetical protein
VDILLTFRAKNHLFEIIQLRFLRRFTIGEAEELALAEVLAISSD